MTMRSPTPRHEIATDDETLRAFADTMPTPVWIADREGRIVYTNRLWCELTGATPADSADEGWVNFVHPEDRPYILDTYKAARERRSDFQFEHRIRAADGRYHWILVIGQPRFDETGQIVGYIGSYVDITERKEAERAREESTATLEAVMKYSPALIYMKDREGRYLYSNERANHFHSLLHGVPMPQTTGKTDYEMYPKETADQFRANDLKVLESGQPLTCEEKVRLPDGMHTYTSVKFPLFDVDGRTIGVGGITLDETERVKMLEALRATEARFRTIVNAIPLPIQIVRQSDGKILFANSRFCDLFGIAPGSETAYSLAHFDAEPDGRERLLAKAARERHLVSYETQCRRLDGSLTWVAVTGEPIFFEGEEAFFAAYEDVNERRKAAIALKESEARFRTIANSLPIAINIARQPDGKLLFANRHFTYLFGIDEESISSHQMPEFYVDIADRNAIIDRLLKYGRVESAEVRARRGDGEPFWVAITAEPVTFEGQGAFLAAFEDITERKRAEQSLQESEQYLLTVLENTADAIVTVDEDGVIQSANQAAEEIFKYARGEMIGRKVNMLFAPGQIDQLAALTMVPSPGISERSGYAERVRTVRMSGLRKGGHEFPAEVVVSSTTLKERPVHIFQLRDVTMREMLQAELLHTEKLATLGRMSAGLTHELNQPLNIIRMAADSTIMSMEEGTSDPEFQMRQLQTIADQAVRMAEMIRLMRVFSRKDVDVPAGSINLVDVVRDAVHLVAQEMRLEGIDIRISVPPSCRPVNGHAVYMEQVIVNLLRNSIDAIADHVRSGAMRREEWIKVSIDDDQASDWIWITVSDTGGGIPDEILPQIFDPFFTSKEPSRGTGLGLSLVDAIVSRMGGHIDVYNTAVGAEVRIRLPVSGRADI